VETRQVAAHGAYVPETGLDLDVPDGNDLSPVLHTRRTDLHGRTPMQREYLRNILSHDLSLGIGPAGTGKTYLAVACAVDALERDSVKRIVLTRPAVEAGERLGFLPGDLTEKVDPYMAPVWEALTDILRDEGYQVAAAANGEEALGLMEHSHFDLVVADAASAARHRPRRVFGRAHVRRAARLLGRAAGRDGAADPPPVPAGSVAP
jgi:hypothetical protein